MQDQCVCVRRGRVPRRDIVKYAAAAPAFIGLCSLATTLAAPHADAASSIAGRIVFLDPGHNGANDASINLQVPTGRGGTKECQTTGTTTDSGFPEHTFNWEVVLLIRQELTQLGVRTAMSRGNDDALGPCVDQRAVSGQRSDPPSDGEDHPEPRPTLVHRGVGVGGLRQR
jgi:N-acetylmuramoyl-L-alanine amidase